MNALYSLENSSDNRCESANVGLGKKGYPGGDFLSLENKHMILKYV